MVCVYSHVNRATGHTRRDLLSPALDLQVVHCSRGFSTPGAAVAGRKVIVLSKGRRAAGQVRSRASEAPHKPCSPVRCKCHAGPKGTCTVLALGHEGARERLHLAQRAESTMFDRGRVDNGAGEGAAFGLSVSLSLTDGTEIKGRLALAQGRTLGDVLNAPTPFVAFEPFDGARRYVAKHAIAEVRPIQPGHAPNLSRMRDVENFDPHATLGLKAGATPEEVRAAYLRQAKAYHPDRYAHAELPEEVKAYLEGMARRMNAAFAALETPAAERQPRAVQRITPIYSSPPR
jgi:hypothetical protein